MRNSRLESPGYNPDLQEAWRKALNIPVRSRRTGYEEVEKRLLATWPPQVSLRERKKTAKIVVTFDFSSLQLSPTHQLMYFGDGINLAEVFEQALSQTPGRGRSTFRSELQTLSYNAYCQAWVRLYEILYLNTSHPSVRPTLWLEAFQRRLARRAGRRKRGDEAFLKKRFKVLLEHCGRLWESVKAAREQESKLHKDSGLSLEIRKRLCNQILKLPYGVSILAAKRFCKPLMARAKSLGQLKTSRVGSPAS